MSFLLHAFPYLGAALVGYEAGLKGRIRRRR